MKLQTVRITGYRSIKEEMLLHLDGRVTVILGANDHGKSNILAAITHLNRETSFTEDDINWDLIDETQVLPELRFQLGLTPAEKKEFLELWESGSTSTESGPNAELDSNNEADSENESELEDAANPENGADLDDESDSAGDAEENEPNLDDRDDEIRLVPKLNHIPDQITLIRAGLGSALILESNSAGFEDRLFRELFELFISNQQPRVEIIAPVQTLNDSVSAEEIGRDENEFMQGIFYTAGLDPMSFGGIFDQNDRTTRRLADSSKFLDEQLRNDWAQGREGELHFQLDHHEGRIELLMSDPSVTERFVRASKRSSGFTHFFSTSMTLSARQKKRPAGSYLWLFDEPGVFLHATGQRDLMQVLESLGESSQIMYATHSLYMINRNFPTRHRLVYKDSSGTVIDGKPFVAQWKAVLNQLGLALPGTVLFAPHVLLCEGDADPIYINTILQILIESGRYEFDINGFSALSTGNSKHAIVLIEVLTSSAAECKLGLLFDGDDGGKKRYDNLKSTIDSKGAVHKFLTAGTTIEDHLPMLRTFYVQGVSEYLYKLGMIANSRKTSDRSKLFQAVETDFEKTFPDPGKEKGVAAWAEMVGAQLFGLPQDPSKVGFAREYFDLVISRLGETQAPKISTSELARSERLAHWIGTELGLPPRLAESAVLSAS